ncbi:MAG: glycosyltransferase family 2 protein [Burkholderiales bacterium]
MIPALPPVSVVTVTRNAQATVGETIGSVLSQQGVVLDYWVIDGGSTDGTVDLIRAHAHRLAGWVSEPDHGIADAFNKGLARSQGDYLMFLNADDALAGPQVLEEMLTAAVRVGSPDVVYADCDVVHPETGAVLYRAEIRYDRQRFLASETLPHPGMLMRRRYFERYGNFDVSYRVAMDYELFLRGIPETGATRVPMLATRVRAGGLSARNRRLVVDETIRALSQHGYLDRLGAARMRANYALRGAARRALEVGGLYAWFDRVRRSRLGGGHA